MLLINDKIDILNTKISNLQSCIITNNREVDLLRNQNPIDQETLDAYLEDINLKKSKIALWQQLLNDLKSHVDPEST